MGGGESTPAQAAAPPPQAPTASSSIQDFIASLPAQLAAQQEFAPQFAALQQQIQQQLFPITSGLQESLAGQAQEGIDDPLSDELREEFLGTQRALAGKQSVGAVGRTDISRNLLGFQEGLRSQNQNLALSLAGRQPLASAQGGQGLQQGISGQALPFAAQRFGTQANIFGTQAGLGIAGLNAQTQRRGQNMDFFGNFLNSGAGTLGAAKLLGF